MHVCTDNVYLLHFFAYFFAYFCLPEYLRDRFMWMFWQIVYAMRMGPKNSLKAAHSILKLFYHQGDFYDKSILFLVSRPI